MMQIFHSLAELASNVTPSVVTVGNFDGVHRGHQMVIDHVIGRAKDLGARSVVITFDPHPAHILHEGPKLPLITPTAAKLALLAATGVDLLLVLPFDEALRQWTAREFVERGLVEGLRALEVHEGETFRFGRNAEAGVGELGGFGREFGFEVHACKPLILRGKAVSSSRIRTLIGKGDLSQARALMGRPFSVWSTPASGRGYGTLYTVPTINLAPYPELLPPHGVTITTLQVGERVFRGVTNSGNRPTFGADSFAVETHLLDFEPVVLTEETPLKLTFLRRLRAEKRFASPEALREQIGLDVGRAKRYFALCDALGVAEPPE